MVVRLLTLALVAVLVTLTACSPDTTADQETDMTLDESLDRLTHVATELHTAAVPDLAPSERMVAPTAVPCGGPGGNEWSRIKYSLESAHGVRVEDPQSAFSAALERARELGLEPSTSGLEFSVQEESYALNFVAHDGVVRILGETPCLDNPER